MQRFLAAFPPNTSAAVAMVPPPARSETGRSGRLPPEELGIHFPENAGLDGVPEMAVSPYLRGLLDLPDLPEEVPAAGRNIGRTRRSTSASLLEQYVALWHSAPMVRLADRDSVVRQWGAAVLEKLRGNGSDAATVRQLGSAFDAIDKASDLLDRRLRQAQQAVQTPAMLERLAARGVTPEQARARLTQYADDVMHDLQPLALQGTVVFPLVPTVDALLEEAARGGRPTRPPVARGPVRATFTEPPTAETTGVPATTTTTPTTLDTLQMPPITNREQALRMLKDFESQAGIVLPQLGSNPEAAAQLCQGVVVFREPMHMAVSMLCADTVVRQPWHQLGVSTRTGAPRPMQATYPGTGRTFNQVRKVYVDQQQAIVQRTGENGVRISLDRLHWIPTGIYTDDTVEAAKLEMWNRIFRQAFERSFQG